MPCTQTVRRIYPFGLVRQVNAYASPTPTWVELASHMRKKSGNSLAVTRADARMGS
jgi:hypothetical protein